MSRILTFCISGMVTLLAIATTTSRAAPAQDRPNILWISTEDTSLEYGCYGDKYSLTPNIDALAKDGLRFAKCFAEAPMCSPSRFTLITGLHPGPMGASQMRSEHRIPDSVKGFPTYLRAAGYYCSNNVKTDYNTAAEKRIIEESWHESSPKAHWRNRKPGQPFFSVFNYMDTHQTRGSQWPYEEFQRNVQIRLTKDWIHDPAKAPLPPYYPDTPLARRTMARYYDCISTLDDFLKERLDELKRDGVAEDTIVVFFADNGGGIPRGKAAPFQMGVHEPLIVWAPEKYRHLLGAAPGTVVDRLVCFADFGPTMLSLAGLDPPPNVDGRAFLGPHASEPAKFVLGSRDRMDETLETTRWLNDGRFHYIRSYRTDVPFDQQTLISFFNAGADSIPAEDGGGWAMNKDGGEICREIRALKAAGKLTPQQEQYWGDSRPAEALYDSESDPWNLKNLVALPEYQEQLAKMRQQLRSWMLEHRDLGFWPEPELADAEERGIPYDEARKEGVYPLERILETAELVGAGADVLPQLRARLKDTNVCVRYWAVVGLHALLSDARPAMDDIFAAVSDPSASVRIEAAWALADIDSSPAALELLAKELGNPNGFACSRAARALELLGEKARPHLAAMQKALAGPRAKEINYSFSFSLQTAIHRLTSGSGR